jgi:hypothetical protein
MKLPADCSYATISPGPLASVDIDLSGCCRGQAQSWLLGDEEPLCRTAGREAEAYRFVWRSSFDGNGIVRIGRQGDEVVLQWRYDHWLRAPAAGDAPAGAALSAGDWVRFREALIAANFWAVDSADERQGLDGAEWLIEGRRGNVYRAVSRWSPQDELRALGRLFFTLAGLPLSKVKLY